MNSGAPLLPAEAPQPSGGLRRQAEGLAGPGARLHRRARPVGRQLQQRRRARQPLGASRRAGSPAPRRCSHCRCQTAKSAYWTGSSGSGEGRPRARRAVERRELAQHHRHRPAVRRRCGGASSASTCSLLVQAEQERAQQRTAPRGRRGAGPPRRSAAPARRRARRLRQAAQVDDGQRRRAPAASITCAGRRPVPRRSGCAAPRGGARSRPAPPRAPRRRARRAAGRRAAGCRAPSPARAGRGTRAAAGRTRAAAPPPPAAGRPARAAARASSARSRVSTPPASAATVGASNRVAQRQLDARSASRTRDTTRVASSEWPPRSKKSSVAPDAGRSPAPRPGSPPGAPRPACRRRLAAPPTAASSGAGRARRSTLPFGVSGSAVERARRPPAPWPPAGAPRRAAPQRRRRSSPDATT